MKEYDIFLPLHYNDGEPVEPLKFRTLQRELLEEFGGFTYFPQPNEGFWRLGAVVYHDEIVVYRVVSRNRRRTRDFMAKLKRNLLKAFRQEEIFIVERDVQVL